MKHITQKDKALLVIEAMVEEGIPFDLEFDIAIDRETDPKLIAISEIFSKIYRYAHVARNPSCIKAHGDWVKDLNKAYKTLGIKEVKPS
jgi:hypothetical protein